MARPQEFVIYSRSETTQLSLIGPSTSKRKLPVNIKEGDLRLFEQALESHAAGSKLLTFNNVRINSDSLLFKRIRILPESFVGASLPTNYSSVRTLASYFIQDYLCSDKLSIPQPCIWFINNWSRNYFHWLTDAIPRLFLVKHLIPTSVVLLPSRYQRFEYIKSSLRPFAIPDLRFIQEKQICLSRQLLLPSETAVTGNYNETVIRKVRHFYAQFYSNRRSSRQFGDKIYISRAKASRRRVLNECEVVDLLTRYGFLPMYFEDLSFEEQATVCLKARYIVSNHGAGLTNMLFMPAESCVLELRKTNDCNNNCYFSLASALGLNYFYQACNCEDNNQDGHGNNVANLIVDVQMLKETIELMLGFEG